MTAPGTKNVFVSIGSRHKAEYEAFLQELISLLSTFGVQPRVMNVTGKDYPTGNPLVGIAGVMQECHGVIVVAFERKFFAEGTEKRNSPAAAVLRDIALSTPWNQIEAALAFGRNLPIIVFAEPGLREEGLLEEKYGWWVERVAIEPSSLGQRAVRTRLQAWCEKLPARAEQPAEPPPRQPATQDLTLRELCGGLTLKTAAQAVVLLVALFGAGVTTGRWFVPTPVVPNAPPH